MTRDRKSSNVKGRNGASVIDEQRGRRAKRSLSAPKVRVVADTYRTSIVRVVLAAAEELAPSCEGRIDPRRLQNFLRGNQNPPTPLRESTGTELFGILAGYEAAWLEEVVEHIIESGELEVIGDDARRVRVSESGRTILANPKHPWLNVFPRPPRLGVHPVVEERLWATRKRLALKEGRAAYGVFPNAVLAAIAARRPRNLAELAAIRGMGESRVRKYGRAILAALRQPKARRRRK